jgi:hypothetical protein
MSTSSRPRLANSLRKRLSGRNIKSKNDEDEEDDNTNENSRGSRSPDRGARSHSSGRASRSPNNASASRNSRSQSVVPTETNNNNDNSTAKSTTSSDAETKGRGRSNVFQRLRERSRSRSRSRGAAARNHREQRKEMLVAVTSCRSDGYYNQKAPGSASKLPRKAPANLKLFHELAVGAKDAYAAVGATPRKPNEEEAANMGREEYEGKMVLWDFIGNMDFVSFYC